MEPVQNKNNLHITGEAGPYAFISYSHADIDIVGKYINAFASTCRFWYDEGIKSGDEWISEIGNKIFNCEVFIVFLSNNAIQSHYIKDEISYAYKYAKKMIAIFLEPVVLDRGTDLMINRFHHIEYKDETSTADNICKILSCLPESIHLSVPDIISKNIESRSDAAADGEYASSELFNDLYTIQKMIGKGGVGEVYSVKSKRTGADYILKKQHIENENADRFKVSKSIARNELEKLLMLNDRPYTPVLIDYMEDSENSYLVMSAMPGVTLRDLFAKNILFSTDDIISLIFRIALILQDVQQQNLVYGDVKPSNLILNSFGQIGLIDFGSTYTLNDTHYTKSYTPHYAAPELLSGEYKGLKFSYDVYALGILFSECLSKVTVSYYDKDSMINRIVSRMTAKSPENRYQTVGEVVAAMELIVPDDYDSKLRSLAHSYETAAPSPRFTVREPFDTAAPMADSDNAYFMPRQENTNYDAGNSLYTCVNYTIAIPKDESTAWDGDTVQSPVIPTPPSWDTYW